MASSAVQSFRIGEGLFSSTNRRTVPGKGTQKSPAEFAGLLAVRTRFELATFGVTGRHSNQLNYRTSSVVTFVVSGCKYTQFFETCKLFLQFFHIPHKNWYICNPAQKASQTVP